MAARIGWEGVFPAITTQFRADFSLDIEATRRLIEAQIRDGAAGLIVCGTVGENASLERSEKIAVMEAAKDVVEGRVPVLVGVAEYTTAFAADFAREAARVGVDGLMVLPATVYSAKPAETLAHFRGVARATDLPIMLYNNPPIYRTDVTPAMLAALADCDTIVCFKESSGDTRRFVDLRNRVGDRFVPFCGLDDVVVESSGWRAPDASPSSCRSTTGSCRCSISTRGPISSSASSCASSLPGAAASSRGRRGCRSKAPRRPRLRD